jgi:hypothetical protein
LKKLSTTTKPLILSFSTASLLKLSFSETSLKLAILPKSSGNTYWGELPWGTLTSTPPVLKIENPTVVGIVIGDVEVGGDVGGVDEDVGEDMVGCLEDTVTITKAINIATIVKIAMILDMVYEATSYSCLSS